MGDPMQPEYLAHLVRSGHDYLHGNSKLLCPEKAYEPLYQAFTRGCVDACFDLTYMSLYGIGVPLNIDEALEYAYLGYRNDCVRSAHFYAYMTITLSHRYRVRSKEEGKLALRYAADSGHPESCHMLGIALLEGEHFDQNIGLAFGYLRKIRRFIHNYEWEELCADYGKNPNE